MVGVEEVVEVAVATSSVKTSLDTDTGNSLNWSSPVPRDVSARTPATADQDNNTRQELDNLNDTTSRDLSTPILPRQTHNEDKMTPTTQEALKYLRKKMRTSKRAIGNAIVSNMKEAVRLHQKERPIPSVNPLSVQPLDEDAFHYYRGDYRDGAHRGDCNSDVTNFDLESSAGQSKRAAVREVVSAIESVGNADQIALALRDTLLHSSMRHHTERVLGNLNTERIKVGLQAVDCMR